MAVSRPFRVAIFGSGPAGIYAADALVRQERVPVRVDVLERLPTPYGLVRYGVAPDHHKIKSVIGVLSRVLEHRSVRFIGGVEFGVHLAADDLGGCYDAVVFATGAPHDTRLGVASEDLPGSHSAGEFVSWYCGHPDAVQPFELDVESVAVIGAGNVALDVARILAKNASELHDTDLPDDVLASLSGSKVREIHLVARRGPEHTKFTTKELRELGELADAEVVIDPAQVANAVVGDGADRRTRTNLDVFAGWAGRAPRNPAPPRRLRIRFWSRPAEILGQARVEGLRLERTALDADGRVRGTGEFETVPVQVVIRAVGYRGAPLAGVPFDDDRGVIRNRVGRVVDASDHPVPGRYVAGWLKRGPVGVIGTNKADAVETVEALLDDLSAPDAPHDRALRPVEDLLAERGVRTVSYHDWLAIDGAELAQGKAIGRPRVKLAGWDSMLTAIGQRDG